MALRNKPFPKMDSRLAQQLGEADTKGQPVQAWFRLKPGDVSGPASAAETAKALAQEIVGRVSKRVGQSAESVTVQPFLGTFTVMARPLFLRELLHQPEIADARATNIPEFGLIKPVESKPVTVRRARGTRGPVKRRRPAR